MNPELDIQRLGVLRFLAAILSLPHRLSKFITKTTISTLIVADNVVRGGGVANADSDDPNVLGLRHFIQMLSEDKRLEATAIQTVGEKGWDGFVMAYVNTF